MSEVIVVIGPGQIGQAIGGRIAVAGNDRDDPEGRSLRHGDDPGGIRQRYRVRGIGCRNRVAVRTSTAGFERRAKQGAGDDAC